MAPLTSRLAAGSLRQHLLPEPAVHQEWECKPLLQSCSENDECCSDLCLLGLCT
jgi:hypothetical protein